MLDYIQTHEVFSDLSYYQPQYTLDDENDDEIIDAQSGSVSTENTPETSNESPTTEETETTTEQPEVVENSPSTRYTDRSQFISDLKNAYRDTLIEKGLDVNYVKYLVAQDALESGWGKSYRGNYNYGNITVPDRLKDTISWTAGQDHDAKGLTVTQRFRNFDSLKDYTNYKVDLLNGNRYKAFTGDISKFYDRVKAGGYAEDPEYVSKLNQIFNQINIGRHGIKLPSFLQQKKSGW